MPRTRRRRPITTLGTLAERLAHLDQARTNDAFATALRSALSNAQARNQAVRQIVAETRARGYIEGQCDPFAPFIAGREAVEGSTRLRDFVDIDGERRIEVSVTGEIEALLTQALKHAGINLRVVLP